MLPWRPILGSFLYWLIFYRYFHWNHQTGFNILWQVVLEQYYSFHVWEQEFNYILEFNVQMIEHYILEFNVQMIELLMPNYFQWIQYIVYSPWTVNLLMKGAKICYVHIQMFCIDEHCVHLLKCWLEHFPSIHQFPIRVLSGMYGVS